MIRILWADDQDDVVKTFSNILSPLKYHVVQAHDGTTAFALINDDFFDLIILDLMMPPNIWGGIWVLERMQTAGIKVPVLILSGEGTQTETIKALRLGAKDYVTKDKIEDELVERIQQITQREVLFLISQGESKTLEFKSTLQWDIKNNKALKELSYQSLKTIAAFLNSEGGILLIGVEDDGSVYGIEKDVNLEGNSLDKFELKLIRLITDRIGLEFSRLVQVSFEDIGEKQVCVIKVKESRTPAFINENEFFIRTGNASRKLTMSEFVEYSKNHWSNTQM